MSVAEEAAAAGFDEIQFDYVRFPDAGGLAFANASDENGRVAAITDFLREARKRLTPYNVFTAMDSFGYVCWNQNDTGIGQRVEDLATAVDIISPMLYPSGFQFGIPGYRNPVPTPTRSSTSRSRSASGGRPNIAGALSALAAGVHRLCLWRQGLRRR